MIPANVAYPAFTTALGSLCSGWEQTQAGIVGPNDVRVTLSQRHSVDNDGHVDVEVIVPGTSDRPARFLDCVSGFGPTAEARARFAAHLWSHTTGAACLEFAYSLRGDFADHYRGVDPGSFTNWHAIAGAIVGFGSSANAGALQQWWLSNSILPCVAQALGRDFSRQPPPHGLKILFGGDGVAEVRIDGESHDAASHAIGALSWPRLRPVAFVRSYVILLHRDDT